MYAGNPGGAHAADPRIARSAAIAGRRPPRLAGRGDRRQGSWSRRDAQEQDRHPLADDYSRQGTIVIHWSRPWSLGGDFSSLRKTV